MQSSNFGSQAHAALGISKREMAAYVRTEKRKPDFNLFSPLLAFGGIKKRSAMN
ncbi:MAG: hypothetical protein KKC20_13100 [Proteobacteria bacterium]|nr:hypothetical protein [Pseudomonadota bacterium]